MLKNLLILVCLLGLLHSSFGQSNDPIQKISLLPGEKIWSGVIKDGQKMPYATGYKYNFWANNQENQIQPLLLGNKGLWVWSEEPYAFEVQDNEIIITNAKGEVKFGHS